MASSLQVIKSGAGNIVELPKVKSAVLAAESRLNGTGRVLLRPSGTEPVVRVMVEGEDSNIVQSVAEELALVVQGAVLS